MAIVICDLSVPVYETIANQIKCTKFDLESGDQDQKFDLESGDQDQAGEIRELCHSTSHV